MDATLQTTQPNEKTSLASPYGCPLITSGARHETFLVATSRPGSVSTPAGRITLSPKSATLACQLRARAGQRHKEVNRRRMANELKSP